MPQSPCTKAEITIIAARFLMKKYRNAANVRRYGSSVENAWLAAIS